MTFAPKSTMTQKSLQSTDRIARLECAVLAAKRLRESIVDLGSHMRMLSISREAVEAFDKIWEGLKREVQNKAIQTSAESADPVQGRKGVRAADGAGDRKVKGHR